MWNDDITFCASECDNTKCRRHPTHIREPQYPHSFAYFKGIECPKEDEDEQEDKQDNK